MPLALVALPPEVLFNILSYSGPFDASLLPSHPLFSLSATCRQLCSTVEEYSRSLLAQHANIAPPKKPKTVTFVCRKKWLNWLTTTCQLCGKKSRRRAILDMGTTCCAKCDRDKFAKMTMTDATIKHHLSKLDMFTPNCLHPDLPPLIVGTYTVMGGESVMISTPSVLARKAHIASLLNSTDFDDVSHMRRRIAAHNRLIMHMDIGYRLRGRNMEWIQNRAHFGVKSLPKSMANEQSRHAYVMKGLTKEWKDIGMAVEMENLPMWCVKQAFGTKCEAEGCGCERLEEQSLWELID
ncbi:hypothetical protein N0V90_003959 [Kalmusia sp. IMI 367209]|nr:hypothetical protein N0V90_003959 [Kalmusia sp. IMI 367209]